MLVIEKLHNVLGGCGDTRRKFLETVRIRGGQPPERPVVFRRRQERISASVAASR